jgi:O-antigen/teichoic acid export membrane protein
VPEFGLLGAAWVSVFSSLVVLLWGGFRVRKLLSFWPYTRTQIKPLVASVVAFTVVSLLVNISINSLFLKLLFVGILSLILFGSILLFLGFDKEERMLFQVVIRKFGFSRNL